jgi:pimeloyl-ACP methyl ester carboxylesterase
MKRSLYIRGLVVAALVLAAPTPAHAGPNSDPGLVAASVAPDNGRSCHLSKVPVALQPGIYFAPGSDIGNTFEKEKSEQYVVVKLCLPTGGKPTTVQVLTHGITYSHRYWNIADPDNQKADTYSWEAAAAKAGYATAAIDRLGNGDSSHPLSNFVDITSNSTALHNVVQALRAGAVEGPGGSHPAFGKVVLVGHSYGSYTSMIEAHRFRDVDAVLLTGFTHKVNNRTPFVIESSVYPAALDPQFAGSGLDPGYVTPRPGTHRQLYYDPSTAVDPRIIDRDAATKGTVSQHEIDNYYLVENVVLNINVPVFLLNGDLDGIFCQQQPVDVGTDCSSAARIVEQEKPFLPGAPSIDAVLIPGVGHDINAFRAAPIAFKAAMTWVLGKVPPR